VGVLQTIIKNDKMKYTLLVQLAEKIKFCKKIFFFKKYNIFTVLLFFILP